MILRLLADCVSERSSLFTVNIFLCKRMKCYFSSLEVSLVIFSHLSKHWGVTEPPHWNWAWWCILDSLNSKVHLLICSGAFDHITPHPHQLIEAAQLHVESFNDYEHLQDFLSIVHSNLGNSCWQNNLNSMSTYSLSPELFVIVCQPPDIMFTIFSPYFCNCPLNLTGKWQKSMN